MMRPLFVCSFVSMVALGASAGPVLKQGDSTPLGGRTVTVTRVDALPFVESEFTKRFRFDSPDNPKLKQLRERYRLDDVVAAGKDEFDRQVLLLDWANRQLKKFGKPTSKARGALDILAAGEQGHTFFCAHYADVLVSAAASLGWVDRPLALRRPDHVGSGSTEHSSTEIWSNDHRKWVMFDPTFAMYVEDAAGVPLNAYEVRQAWFYDDARGLTFVLAKDRKRLTKADLPWVHSRHAGFGELKLDGGALNPYAFIGYVPNTDLMTAGYDYGRMFITRDKLCDGTKWHTRIAPTDPAVDPYFPINQAAVTLTADGDAIRVAIKTLTPNFKTFEARVDGGAWAAFAGDVYRWTPKAGEAKLEVRSVNVFGVPGPVSTIEIR